MIFPFSADYEINSLRTSRFRGEILAKTFDRAPVSAEGATPAESAGERSGTCPHRSGASGANLHVGRNTLPKTEREIGTISGATGIKTAFLLTRLEHRIPSSSLIQGF
jgi:hypothetical protein